MKGHFGDDITAYEDVMIDEEEQLVVATVAAITSKRVSPTIGYHDIAEVLFRKGSLINIIMANSYMDLILYFLRKCN